MQTNHCYHHCSRWFTELLLYSVLITVLCLLTVSAFADEADPSDDYASSAEEPGSNSNEEGRKIGLIQEDGSCRYYYEDGTFATGLQTIDTENGSSVFWFDENGLAWNTGYKVISVNGVRTYYYFQEDGTAYNNGLYSFTLNDKTYYFYFQSDGTAFTGGYKEVEDDGTVYYYYFLPNGQGYNTGYKTVMIDGKKYYFYFGSDARALVSTAQTVTLGDKTAYYLLQADGRAFTGGYIEVPDGENTDYYYYLPNGQAFNTGYKTVKIDGSTYYFYFESDGKAFKGGLREVSFGTLSYEYLFEENGRAVTGEWRTLDGTETYFADNGRRAVSSFITMGDILCYFNADGAIQKNGWFTVNNGCYYADSSGALLTDTIYSGYKLDSNGRSLTRYKVLQELENVGLSDDMTDEQKLEKIYDWVVGNNMGYKAFYEHISRDWTWPDGWTDDFVSSMIDEQAGNCYRYASLLGYLIHEATDYSVSVVHGTWAENSRPHGWVVVTLEDGNRYFYDCEVDKYNDHGKEYFYKQPIETAYTTNPFNYRNAVDCPLD